MAEEKVEKKGEGEEAEVKSEVKPEAEAKAEEPKAEAKVPEAEGEGEEVKEEPQTPQALCPDEPDWKDQYARLLADFDNFKKRTARDREDTYRFAEASILKDVLPTVDNLALALEHAQNKDDEFVKGVQLVYDALLKSLKDHGAEPFDCVGQALDTEKMEAIATLPNADVEEGKVSIESKRGWMLKDKVLRAAQVVVSSGKPA